VLNRQARFWLHSDLIFNMTEDSKIHQECLKILHGFSYRMIRERKETMRLEKEKQSQADQNNNQVLDENGNEIGSAIHDDDDTYGKKKRLAFLDLLITASGNGTILTDEDIREEVDTFVCLCDIE
jgi:cytochrome P450 family 4